LNRYEGNRFVVFHSDPVNPASLSDNYITTLLEDHQGTIWIGTYNGWLNRFDRATGKITRVPFDRQKNRGGPGLFGAEPIPMDWQGSFPRSNLSSAIYFHRTGRKA
jgi:hypothetical protein